MTSRIRASRKDTRSDLTSSTDCVGRSSAQPRDHLLAEEAHGLEDAVVGYAAARERAHEVGDAERLVVRAQLVRDLLGVAEDRRDLERLLVGELEQVLAD